MTPRTCTTGVEHVLNPDHHLCCKLTYWREVRPLHVTSGSVGGVLQGPEGRKAFHGDHRDGGTINERREKMVAEARAKGIEPVPVGVRHYAGPVSV